MKINILERSKNSLRIELIGEGHTFCNALHEILSKDNTVPFVGYNLPHPLIAEPIFYIRTKGRRKPETALVKGSKNLIKNLVGLQKAFRKTLQKKK